MHVERDPRCPAHPGYEVLVMIGGGDGYPQPLRWACSACLRELGVASIDGTIKTVKRWAVGARRRRPADWG